MKEVASSSTWLDPCSTITVPRWTPPRVVRWLGGHGLGAPYDLLAALGRRSPSGSISADQFTLGICKLRYVSHQDPVGGVLLLWVRLSAHGGDCIDLKKKTKKEQSWCARSGGSTPFSHISPRRQHQQQRQWIQQWWAHDTMHVLVVPESDWGCSFHLSAISLGKNWGDTR